MPTGGIEQNGPHMILGKHDYIVGVAAEPIATELGHTLVAPVVSYVPEGGYDPPEGNLRFPGTIGVPDDVYAGVLEGIARSLKARRLQDHLLHRRPWRQPGPQAERRAEAQPRMGGRRRQGDQCRRLLWRGTAQEQNKLLIGQGETLKTIGQHASITDTSELMAVHPQGVDLTRLASFPFPREPTGADGDARRASAERGRALIALKVEAAVRQIRAMSAGM